MELLTEISVRRTQHSRLPGVDFQNLEFGKYVADHMLVMDFDHGQWEKPVIVPFSNLSMNPATLALHYGQTVFEGMKAFKMKDGRFSIFRIDRHYERFARSLDRMCMAIPPKDLFTEGLIRLVETDKDWIPDQPGALYLRPFMYASEAKFGIKISDQYRFIVFSGPVPEVFSSPVKLKVETDYIRAARGGTGYVKCGGNYGAALYPARIAKEQGYDQLLWTDAREHRFIEESGMMNIMFVIDGVIVTPPISDSILDGVTRDSLLTLATDSGYQVEERPISVDELENAFRQGTITEAFGAGTAAVVAPVKLINYNGVDYHFPEYSRDSISNILKLKLEAIRTGRAADPYGWNTIV